MSVLCGWASIDENGKTRGGSPGDQTGREVKTGSWYYFGQNVLLRWKDRSLAHTYANLIKLICLNDRIGYNQLSRTTLDTQLRAVGNDPSKITVPCDTDCSAMVAAACRAMSLNVSKDCYTGNLKSALKATGYFDVYTESKFLTKDSFLMEGDIILSERHHVISSLGNGDQANVSKTNTYNNTVVVKSSLSPEPAKFFDKTIAGTYKVAASALNMRTGASTSKPIIAVLKNSSLVKNYGYYSLDTEGAKWYYIAYGSYTGYVLSKYLTK